MVKKKWLFLLLFLLLSVTGYYFYSKYTDPVFIQHEIKELLAKSLPPEAAQSIDISEARLENKTVYISGITVLDTEKKILATIQEVKVELASLLSFKISAIVVSKPEVFIRKNKDTYNFSHFFKTSEELEDPSTQKPPVLPEIKIEDGKISYQDPAIFNNDFLATIDQFYFSLFPAASQKYSLKLDARTNLSTSALHLEGQYDTTSVNNVISISPLVFETSLLATKTLLWPEFLEVEGNLSIGDMHFLIENKEFSGKLEANLSSIIWKKDIWQSCPVENFNLKTNFSNQNISSLIMSCSVLGETISCDNGYYKNEELYLPLYLRNINVNDAFLAKWDFLDQRWLDIRKNLHPNAVLDINLVVEKQTNANVNWFIDALVKKGSFLYQQRQALAISNLNLEARIDKSSVQIKKGSWNFSQGKFTVEPDAQIKWDSLKFEKCKLQFSNLKIAKTFWNDIPEAKMIADFLQAEGTASGSMIFPEKIDPSISKDFFVPVHYLPTIKANVKNAKAKIQEAPFLLEDIEGHVTFDKGVLSFKNFSGISKSNGAKGYFSGKVWPLTKPEPCLDIKISVKEGSITPEVYQTFSINQSPDSWHSIVREVWHQINPKKGMLDINIHVMRKPERVLESPEVYVKVKSYNAQITYKDFVYPLTDVNGMVIIDFNRKYSRISIKDFEAKSDTGRFYISGILIPEEDDLNIDFQVRGNNVSLNDKLKNALNEKNQKIWSDFSPSGFIDVEVAVKKEANQKKADWKADIDVKNASILHPKFCHVVEKITGQISITEKEFLLENIVGKSAQDAEVKARGIVKEKEFDISVNIKDLVLEDKLYGYIPEGNKIRDSFAVEGKINLDLQFYKQKDKEFDWKGEILLNHLSGRYQLFPYYFDDIYSKLEINSQVIQIKKGIMKRGITEVTIEGNISPKDYYFKIKGQNVVVDKELHGCFSPEMKKQFESFQMSGMVNMELEMQKRENPLLLMIYPKNLYFVYKYFPYKLENITSSSKIPIRVDSHSVQLNSLVSDSNHGKININGTIGFLNNGQSVVELKCKAKNLKIDAYLRDAISLYFPELIKTLKPKGKIEDVDFSIFYKEENKNPYMRYEIAMNKLEATMEKTAPLKYLSGNFYFEGFSFEEKNVLEGNCKKGLLQLGSIEIDNINTPIKFFNSYLVFEPFVAQIYEGDLKGSFIIDTSSYGAYKGQFNVQNTDLQQLVSAIKGKKDNITGTLTGAASFQSIGYGTDQISGKGWVKIKDGYLWELPIFLAIFDLFSLPSKPAFREGEMHFSLLPKTVIISSLDLHSSLLSISGQGSIRNGICNIRLLTHFAPRIIPRIPIIGQMWNYFKRGFLGLSLTGTFGNPMLSYLHWKEIQDLIK